MKVELDLNEILRDEFGDSETLSASINRQVVQQIHDTVIKGIRKKIDDEINLKISEAVETEVVARMGDIMDDILNAEFTPVDTYGQKGEPTTFRKQLVKSVNQQMVYKKVAYSNDRNVFTKAVDDMLESKMKEVAVEYKKTVDEAIAKQAFELAIDTLKKKLGLSVNQR